MIPKPDGGERPLGIPTVRDPVVQQAAKLVLEPIFEADFEPNAYGYRPGRSALDAVAEVKEAVLRRLPDRGPLYGSDIAEFSGAAAQGPRAGDPAVQQPVPARGVGTRAVAGSPAGVALACMTENQSESRMRENCKSGSMSGSGKPGYGRASEALPEETGRNR
jgi:hypothetical protein